MNFCNPNEPESDTDPLFLEFIDAVWQVTLQFPEAFEFNENLLVALLDAVQSGMYGNFLHSTEKGSNSIFFIAMNLTCTHSQGGTTDPQEDSVFLAANQHTKV